MNKYYLNSGLVDRDFYNNFIRNDINQPDRLLFETALVPSEDCIEFYRIEIKNPNDRPYEMSSLWFFDIGLNGHYPLAKLGVNTSSALSLTMCGVDRDVEEEEWLTEEEVIAFVCGRRHQTYVRDNLRLDKYSYCIKVYSDDKTYEGLYETSNGTKEWNEEEKVRRVFDNDVIGSTHYYKVELIRIDANSVEDREILIDFWIEPILCGHCEVDVRDANPETKVELNGKQYCHWLCCMNNCIDDGFINPDEQWQKDMLALMAATNKRQNK
jgi:hypothetical protein